MGLSSKMQAPDSQLNEQSSVLSASAEIRIQVSCEDVWAARALSYL
jgi:hypothetical protein